MIVQGNELSVFQLMEYYANRNQCYLVYMDLSTYNALDTSKKATVNSWYEGFNYYYTLDIIKQVEYNN